MEKMTMQGTYTAIITPFLADGAVDFDGLKKLIDFQAENGVDGVVVCGSTGESATLTYKEKVALILRCVEYAQGRIKIIAGTGSNDTQITHDMTLAAKEYGADAALIVAPYYNKPTQEGLFEHYRITAESVDIPIILYNIPGRSGVNINAETQLKLAETCSNIIAVKDASADLELMMTVIKYAPAHFSVLSGDDYLTLPLIALGAKGVVSTISNYAPKLFSDMVNLALKGKLKEAKKIHYSLFELMKLNFIETNPIPVKTLMAKLGFTEDVFRLPLLPMTKVNKEKLFNAAKEAGFIK